MPLHERFYRTCDDVESVAELPDHVVAIVRTGRSQWPRRGFIGALHHRSEIGVDAPPSRRRYTRFSKLTRGQQLLDEASPPLGPSRIHFLQCKPCGFELGL